jgi:hypothetical protein
MMMNALCHYETPISLWFIKKGNDKTDGIANPINTEHISKALSIFDRHFKERYPIDTYIIILAWLIKVYT